jgi:hypothetical protein
MHMGPRTHGTERASFRFRDDSRGDMYRAILLAIAQQPPRLDIPYADLMSRVQSVCVGAAPTSQSVIHACRQIAAIARERHSDQRIIEWDNSTLSIVDPYLLFYLRGSRKLSQLASSS